MRILSYYMVHTFINSIKKLFKTWVAIFILIIVGMGVIGGVVGGIIGSKVDEKQSESSYEETVEQDDKESFSPTEKDVKNIIEVAVAVITLVVILFNMYNGDKSGTKIFTMPDVNFLFSSPLKPQSVLMFRTVLQMGLALVSSLYLIFQIPNLVFNAGLKVQTAIILLIAWFMIIFLGQLTSVVTYTLTATHQNLRKYIRPTVITIAGAILIAFLYLLKIKQYGILETSLKIFASKAGRYIPVFGWLRGFVMSSVNGDILGIIIYLLLLILISILFTILIWKIKADFYEDALSNAAEAQAKLDNAKSGATTKRKKDRSDKIHRNGELNGSGANVFLTKTIYNRKRFSKFGVLSSTGGTYILLALLIFVFFIKVINLKSVLPIGFTILIAIFFRNLGNPIAEETAHDFIYLIPESPFKKLFYTLLGGLYETALDTLPVAVIAAIFMQKDYLQILLWYILWVSFDAFCSSAGLFIELLIPTSVVPTIKAMLTMMIRMIAIIPGLLVLVFGIIASVYFSTILIVIAINIGVSALLFIVSPRFLHNGKN